MPGFAVKYTPAQRDAILTAILDQNMSAKQACAAGKAGELPGLEPFEMALSTAQEYARIARRRRRDAELGPFQRLEPRAALLELERQLIRSAERYALRIQDRERTPRNRPTDKDLKGFAEMIGAVASASRAVHFDIGTSRASGKRLNEEAGAPGATSGLLSALADRQRRDKGRASRATQREAHKEQGAAGTHETEGENDHGRTRPVSVSASESSELSAGRAKAPGLPFLPAQRPSL